MRRPGAEVVVSCASTVRAIPELADSLLRLIVHPTALQYIGGKGHRKGPAKFLPWSFALGVPIG